MPARLTGHVAVTVVVAVVKDAVGNKVRPMALPMQRALALHVAVRRLVKGVAVKAAIMRVKVAVVVAVMSQLRHHAHNPRRRPLRNRRQRRPATLLPLVQPLRQVAMVRRGRVCAAIATQIDQYLNVLGKGAVTILVTAPFFLRNARMRLT